MLSYDQQGANVNTDMSFNDIWAFLGQTQWTPNPESTQNYYQQWSQQDKLYQVQQSEIESTVLNQDFGTSVAPLVQQCDFIQLTGAYQNWRQSNSIGYCSSNPEPTTINPVHNFNQTFQVLPSVVPESKFNASSSASRFRANAQSHHARITLVPTSSGFKTIVKRKRKRTMFRTEQIEALEAVFAKKPYISREDRQILADQLQVSDNVVKVWFQNRRIREKKENEEAQFSSPGEDSSSSSAQLDHLESTINQNADELGYVTLDDTAMNEIVTVIDTVLTDKIDFDIAQNNNSQTVNQNKKNSSIGLIVLEPDSSTPPESCSNILDESAMESEGSIYAGSIYEPISPASSVNVDEEARRFEPVTADKSLQRLFDLHFC